MLTVAAFIKRFPGILCALTLFVMMPGANAFGHAIGESYIWLNPQADFMDGRVEFRLEDLREHMGMEIPEDYAAAKIRIMELAPELKEYVKEHFQIVFDGQEIAYEFVEVDLLEANKFGHFVQLFFKTSTLVVPDVVTVKSDMLFEFSKFQRCLLCTEYNHKTGKSYTEAFFHHIFNPWSTEQDVDFQTLSQVQQRWRTFVWQGVLHIWIGIDHILFLVALLLAAVLVKRDESEANTDSQLDTESSTSKDQWVPVAGFTGAFWNVFKIVTIFTVAHSITLCLASLGIITLPSQLVESIIALSIVLVAFNNIVPTFRDRTWVILFLFGLFHGLGFASVMQHLPYRVGNLNKVLIGFNVGVELGQMAIVAAVFPIMYFLRKTSFYKPVFLVGGSIVLIAIASYWFVERAFGL